MSWLSWYDYAFFASMAVLWIVGKWLEARRQARQNELLAKVRGWPSETDCRIT